MSEQDWRRRQEQDLLRIRAREAVAKFRLALADVIAPHDDRLRSTSRLLTEARRELAACRRLLDELDDPEAARR
jgi:hypothetical protein